MVIKETSDLLVKPSLTNHTSDTMPQTFKFLFHIAGTLTCLFVLFALPVNAHAKKAGDIVVTIKPLYSLVAQLSDGITQPVLLMKQMPSAHHYSMKPSDRRLLAQASIIIWIGPQMESYLDKTIRQQDAMIISAMQADGLKLLERRIKNDGQHNTEHSAHNHHGHLDPHIWLSAHNAIAISRHITGQLTSYDPENTSRYEKNLQQVIDKISRLAAEIKASLKNKQQPFITYHDAFQYFEKENNLRYIDSINFSEEAGTSLKHLRHIKAEIKQKQIQCLLYQPPEPDIIKTLTAGSTIKAVALDPLGLRVKNDEDAWFEIMKGIAENFKRCLNS